MLSRPGREPGSVITSRLGGGLGFAPFSFFWLSDTRYSYQYIFALPARHERVVHTAHASPLARRVCHQTAATSPAVVSAAARACTASRTLAARACWLLAWRSRPGCFPGPGRGLGGVGKSQLALEYSHRERTSGRYQIGGWVRADSPVTVARTGRLAARSSRQARGQPWRSEPRSIS